MRLFPLVLNIPVRFTNSLNRNYGVFKHSRGWIRGWKLTAAELERLSSTDDPEIVLLEPPEEIYIEVETATSAMPKTKDKCIYTHRPTCRPWFPDKQNNVKLLRWFFASCLNLEERRIRTADQRWPLAWGISWNGGKSLRTVTCCEPT